MKRLFPKPSEARGTILFISFPNSLHSWREVGQCLSKWNGRNIATEISGPPPEVIPNIPVGRNRNGPSHLNCVQNFRNLWHKANHPPTLTQLQGFRVKIVNYFNFLLSLNSQKRLGYRENNTKYRSLSWNPRSHVRIFIYRTWPIGGRGYQIKITRCKWKG